MANVIKSTCNFCLKPISKTKNSVRPEDNVSLSETGFDENIEVERFVKSFNKYCTVNKKESGNTINQSTACCAKCFGIIKSFNHLYHEMECLKLKLDWKLDELKVEMEHANRVPSRFHRITINATLEDRLDLLKETLIFRRDFVESCSNHLSKSTPKVKLRRHKYSPPDHFHEVPCPHSGTFLDNTVPEQLESEIEAGNTCQVKKEEEQNYLEDDSVSITNSFDHNSDQIPIDIQYHLPDIKPFHSEPDNNPPLQNLDSTLKETKMATTEHCCSKCDKKFINKYKLVRHTWHEHTSQGKKPRDQIIIPETSTTIGEWVNKVGAKFKCSESICTNINFMTEEDLQEHSKLHGSFPCPFCEEVKAFAPDLATHELEVHGSLTKRLKLEKCPRCEYRIPKNLSRDSYLNHHLLRHQQLLFDACRCPICKKAFFSKTKGDIMRNLLIHWLSIHDNSSPDLVQWCKTPVLSTRKLKKNSANSRKKGKKIKASKHEYHCKICNKSFPESNKLKRHFFALHGEQGSLNSRFECKLCGKRFLDKFNFHRHQKTLHLNKDLVCQQCGTKSVNYKALQQHVLRFHPKKK